MSSADFKADLQGLHIVAAKEVDVSGGRKAIVIFVPFKQLRDYHKIQPKLVRELEKKFSGKHVMIIGQRTILAPTAKRSGKVSGPRPRTRTLTSVHEAILEVWATLNLFSVSVVLNLICAAGYLLPH